MGYASPPLGARGWGAGEPTLQLGHAQLELLTASEHLALTRGVCTHLGAERTQTLFTEQIKPRLG